MTVHEHKLPYREDPLVASRGMQWPVLLRGHGRDQSIQSSQHRFACPATCHETRSTDKMFADALRRAHACGKAFQCARVVNNECAERYLVGELRAEVSVGAVVANSVANLTV